MNNRSVGEVCSEKGCGKLVVSCRNSLAVNKYLLFSIYKHLYVSKVILDEQGEESFNSYSLAVACKPFARF